MGVVVRKALFISFVAGVLAVGVSSLASGATARCNTRYTPACTGPVIGNATISAACRNRGTTIRLPNITFRSLPGIRTISVKVGSRKITSRTFKRPGPQRFTLRNVRINTAGFGSGVHRVTVTVTDVRGKKATRTLRFAICRPPVFTG